MGDAARAGSTPVTAEKPKVYGPALRWTEDDDADLLARRKAADYRKPSQDIGRQGDQARPDQPQPEHRRRICRGVGGLEG